MPEFLFYLQHKNDGMIINLEKNDRKIDVEAQNIYLVKLIHETQDGYASVKINNTEKYMVVSEHSEIKKEDFISQEFKKLAEYGIFKPLEEIQSSNEKYLDYSAEIVNRVYSKNNAEYLVTDVSLNGEAYTYSSLQVENKTKKILSLLGFDKEFFVNLDKEQIMRNYVNYLGLHIIDDWKFENNCLKSEKAGLEIYLHAYSSTTNNMPKYSLSICSSTNDIVNNGKVIYSSSTE